MLTRNDILNRAPTIETVSAFELGEGATLGVKLLSAAEFMAMSSDPRSKGDKAYAAWLLACVCDEAGKPVFATDDFDALTSLPFTLVNRLIEVAQKINGTTETAAKN
jgi:hypothetical protein